MLTEVEAFLFYISIEEGKAQYERQSLTFRYYENFVKNL